MPVVTGDPPKVVVIEEEKDVVYVATAGAQGPPGPAGAQGPPGSEIVPADPKYTKDSVIELAAGASAYLDGDIITTGQLGTLTAVSVGGSTGASWELISFDGSDEVVDVVYTSQAELSDTWAPPSNVWFPLIGNGSRRFRVRVTNLDTIDAVDFHATIYWDEV